MRFCFDVLRLGAIRKLVAVLCVFVGGDCGILRTTRAGGPVAVACWLSYYLAGDVSGRISAS